MTLHALNKKRDKKQLLITTFSFDKLSFLATLAFGSALGLGFPFLFNSSVLGLADNDLYFHGISLITSIIIATCCFFIGRLTLNEQNRLLLFKTEELEEAKDGLSSLYHLSKTLADAAPKKNVVLDIIIQEAVKTLHTTYALVCLKSWDHIEVVISSSIRDIDQNLSSRYKSQLSSKSFFSRVMKQDKPFVVSKNDERLTEIDHEILFQGGTKSVCLIPLFSERESIGLLVLGEEHDEERHRFNDEKIKLAVSVGSQAVSAICRAELFSELERNYLETVMALAKAVDAKDSYTADHSNSIIDTAIAIGIECGLGAKDLEDLRYGAILHDVGKIGITDSILQKPAKLDESEWNEMRQHPLIGEEILAPIPHLSGAAKLVRHHHERFEGNGYPDELAGKDIPLGARIISVVDSYSAMVDWRVYKEKPLTHKAALHEIKRCAGTEFDPEIVDIFIRMADRIVVNHQIS
jgi:HD-GYP domain-containing protein (c-di-GMP phosphodiesterase class II)